MAMYLEDLTKRNTKLTTQDLILATQEANNHARVANLIEVLKMSGVDEKVRTSAWLEVTEYLKTANK